MHLTPEGTAASEACRAEQPAETVLVVVRPGRRTGTVLAWLRQLLPAAVLLVSPATFPPAATDEASIVIEADDVDSPLSLADALARAREGTASER